MAVIGAVSVALRGSSQSDLGSRSQDQGVVRPRAAGGGLDRAGVRPGYAVDDGPYEWERTRTGDDDVPTRPALLLHAISERQRWKADYEAAQLAVGPRAPDNRSATRDQGEAA